MRLIPKIIQRWLAALCNEQGDVDGPDSIADDETKASPGTPTGHPPFSALDLAPSPASRFLVDNFGCSLYDAATKLPKFTMHHLSTQHALPHSPPANRGRTLWKADSRLPPAYCVNANDMKGLQWDRGHLVPAGDADYIVSPDNDPALMDIHGLIRALVEHNDNSADEVNTRIGSARQQATEAATYKSASSFAESIDTLHRKLGWAAITAFSLASVSTIVGALAFRTGPRFRQLNSATTGFTLSALLGSWIFRRVVTKLHPTLPRKPGPGTSTQSLNSPDPVMDMYYRTVKATYKLSNTSPMFGPEFNSGYWGLFEAWTRGLTLSFADVFVITMPLFRPQPGPDGELMFGYRAIPSGKTWIHVPTHFAKVIVAYNAITRTGSHVSAADRVASGQDRKIATNPPTFFDIVADELEKGRANCSSHDQHNFKGGDAAIGTFVLPNTAITPHIPLRVFASDLDTVSQQSGVFFPEAFHRPDLLDLRDIVDCGPLVAPGIDKKLQGISKGPVAA